MDEHDLRALAGEPLGPAGRPRAVDDVLRRGGRLRRRATIVRATPVVVVIALAASAGILALRDDRPPEPETRAGPPASLLPQPPASCDPDTALVPAAELEGLRLAPVELPDGVALATMTPERYFRSTCVEVDPALLLRAGDANGTVDAEIALTGPFAEPHPDADDEALEPTQLRGREAFRVFDPTAPDTYTAFTWTEPDGTSWFLNGVGVGEATVRDVAEALELQAAPAEGEPVAALPDDAMPPGFEVAWQPPGMPAVEGETRLEWFVDTTPAWPADGCAIRIRTTALHAPPGRLFRSGTVASEVDVRGRPGFALEENGSVFLDWEEAPGVFASVSCAGDLETALRVADSLVEVEPDDPRIVTAAPANGSSG
jgi:hypothetical protein